MHQHGSIHAPTNTPGYSIGPSGENLNVVTLALLAGIAWEEHVIHAVSTNDENSAQVSSCQLKFVPDCTREHQLKGKA
jgi:hypothetical protein